MARHWPPAQELRLGATGVENDNRIFHGTMLYYIYIHIYVYTYIDKYIYICVYIYMYMLNICIMYNQPILGYSLGYT